MLVLAHGNMNWTLSATQAACMRHDLCQSIIDVTLITYHSLHNAALTPEHANLVDTADIIRNINHLKYGAETQLNYIYYIYVWMTRNYDHYNKYKKIT